LVQKASENAEKLIFELNHMFGRHLKNAKPVDFIQLDELDSW
jgi:hypothetical protein